MKREAAPDKKWTLQRKCVLLCQLQVLLPLLFARFVSYWVCSYPGFLRILEKYGKKFGHFPACKIREEKFFSSFGVERGNNFPDFTFLHAF